MFVVSGQYMQPPMKYRLQNRAAATLLVLLLTASSTFAASPWGSAKVLKTDYVPQKVVYDVAVPTEEAFTRLLDRVSYLNNLYHADPFEASIVVVLHGDEIPFFAIDSLDRYRDLMQRAQSLTLAGPVEFRMCKVAARAHGYEAGDIHGFISMVPMADAEIIRLQQEEGYAYMQ
jgi:intracellular sulfur oxidation DsrE/DsrF family protein